MTIHVLSCTSISLLDNVLFPLRLGLSGLEKIPLTGSRPNSSRTPVSLRVMPVFLRNRQYFISRPTEDRCPLCAYRPTLPGSKNLFSGLLRRPGVPLAAGAMLRGLRFSLSGSRIVVVGDRGTPRDAPFVLKVIDKRLSCPVGVMISRGDPVFWLSLD